LLLKDFYEILPTCALLKVKNKMHGYAIILVEHQCNLLTGQR